LPRGFTFLNLPAGVYDIGNVVVPTTPLADLQLFSYSNLLGSPISGEITDQSSGLRMQSPSKIFPTERRRRVPRRHT
jgi:hypothetical protein